jgi:hypothetical protein
MVTSQGVALIVELIAPAFLIAALAGFIIRRSKPWLVNVAMAVIVLIVAATIIIESSA